MRECTFRFHPSSATSERAFFSYEDYYHNRFSKFSHAPFRSFAARCVMRIEVIEDEMTIEKKEKKREKKERRIKDREEVLYKEREEW